MRIAEVLTVRGSAERQNILFIYFNFYFQFIIWLTYQHTPLKPLVSVCVSYSDLLPLDLLARALPNPGQALPTQVGHLERWSECWTMKKWGMNMKRSMTADYLLVDKQLIKWPIRCRWFSPEAPEVCDWVAPWWQHWVFQPPKSSPTVITSQLSSH